MKDGEHVATVVSYRLEQDGEAMLIVEALPADSEPKFKEDMKIAWEFMCGLSMLPSVIGLFPRKHIYFAYKMGAPGLLVGFSPKLTENQRDKLKGLTAEPTT